MEKRKRVEKYLEKRLNSLVNQTIDGIEIIVINDVTKDNSQDIIDRFCHKYPKLIKSIVKENGGQGSARNIGISIATSEYIAFVDSDDYVEQNMFELLYKARKHENYNYYHFFSESCYLVKSLNDFYQFFKGNNSYLSYSLNSFSYYRNSSNVLYKGSQWMTLHKDIANELLNYKYLLAKYE